MHNIDPSQLFECIQKVRETRPHIHCITNSVAQAFTANVLLAIGATPSMTIAASEIEGFVTMADGLLVNLGTMDAERKLAIKRAVDAVQRNGKPWGLDPVFVQASTERLKFARILLPCNPALVRLNAREFSTLFGEECNRETMCKYAKVHRSVFAVTGARDVVVADEEFFLLENGAPVMDRVTAMGCALTAVLLAFATVIPDQKLATVAGLSLYNIAGEIAAENSQGPGTFVAAFIDQLANVTEEQVVERLRAS